MQTVQAYADKVWPTAGGNGRNGQGRQPAAGANGLSPQSPPAGGVQDAYDPYDDIRSMPVTKLDALDVGHHPRVKTAVEAARTWARRYNAGEDPAPWLVLVGDNGTGKTHIARSIWSAFHYTQDDAGRPIRLPRGSFLAAGDLMYRLDPRTEGGYAESVPVSGVIGSAPMVVIDDVGAENVIQFIGGALQEHERVIRYFRFIDFCYINRIPGVITSNLPLAELAEHLGRRAWDRLCQMAPRGQMVSLEGVPSWRVKAGGR